MHRPAPAAATHCVLMSCFAGSKPTPLTRRTACHWKTPSRHTRAALTASTATPSECAIATPLARRGGVPGSTCCNMWRHGLPCILCDCRLHGPRAEDDRSIDSEASLASRWDAAVAVTLTDLGRKLPGGVGIEWVQQPPSDILQDALQFTTQRCTQQLQQPSPQPPRQSSCGRPLLAPRQHLEDTASGPSTSGKRKVLRHSYNATAAALHSQGLQPG